MPPSNAPILVVDDDLDIREALRDSLEQEGYAAAIVRDGGEALTYLRTHSTPPLILLDWNMAPMNAPQFMEEFAKDPGFNQVPVVLITADARGAERAKSGYSAYLRKPLDLDTLFGVVGRYCSRQTSSEG